MKKGTLQFRTLKAEEIECRVGSVSAGKGVSLLLYKDARVDMRLLDEVVGAMNWERSHELINGNLFCSVTITTEDGRRVTKQDVGVESNTEKEKGQASDAFKRACFNWGIGRELYTSPFIWITINENEWRDDTKRQPKTTFSVKSIEYNEDREVSYLCIVDNKGTMRYTFGKPANATETEKPLQSVLTEALAELAKVTTTEQGNELWKKYESLQRNRVFLDAVGKKSEELKQVKK